MRSNGLDLVYHGHYHPYSARRSLAPHETYPACSVHPTVKFPRATGFALLILSLLAIALVPVGHGEGNDEESGQQPASKITTAPKSSLSVEYGEAKIVGNLSSPYVRESSGLGTSRDAQPFLWTHNDSGNKAQIYAFDFTGKHLATLPIEGSKCVDWEDMAAFRWKDKPYILLGDMGDNRSVRKECQLYLVPDTARQGDAFAKTLRVERTIRFAYEGGPRDCEGLAFDEATQSFLLVSKTWGAYCDVFQFAMPAADDDGVQTAKPISRLKLAGFTGFDISPDSSRAIGSTYGHAYEFSRLPEETWAEAFRREPNEIVLPPRKQGEGICYGADGKTIYTSSEGFRSPLIEVLPE